MDWFRHPGVGDADEMQAIASHSGRLLNSVGQAQLLAAQTLLSKAARSVSAGDAARAERLIERAARIPYEDRERHSPGLAASVSLVHDLITDEFEASDTDDLAWLDPVLSVHPHLDATGQAVVASVVHGFVLQSGYYTVGPRESRRIRQLFGYAPLNVELGDGPDISMVQMRQTIRSLVHAAAALGDAYASQYASR